ncbi:MAG: hypothetical protein HY505_02970 [Candidatus Yanofskybacteria bacterium]|nr:hypothetical protein [Candidatus Yanofskybacteria bacterium]
MKKFIFVSTIAAFLPVYALAHGGPMMNFSELQTGPEMMEYVEEGVLGDELHEEMEQLMVKMMSGKMTEDEGVRISEMMNKYPGPYGMMMNRLNGDGGSWRMMSGWNSVAGWGMLWLWIFMFSWLVWVAAGILLVVWLFRKLFSAK